MQPHKLLNIFTQIITTVFTLFLFVCTQPENDDDSHPFNNSNPEEGRFAPKADAVNLAN